MIVAPGGGASIQPLLESPLGPYLPATPTGANYELTAAELTSLSNAYRPPRWPDGRVRRISEIDEDEGTRALLDQQFREMEAQRLLGDTDRYYRPAPIQQGEKNQLFLAGLEPRPGSTVIPLGDEVPTAEGPPRHLAVERRVGHGRITILGLDLNHPALLRWPGRDTLIRRVVLRRPEEAPTGYAGNYHFLSGPQLTWLSYLGRDLGAPQSEVNPEVTQAQAQAQANANDYTLRSYGSTGAGEYLDNVEITDILNLRRDSVAAWMDEAEIPRKAREMLSTASGITIPGAAFVATVVLAYLAVLVPLNFFVCRFIFRRLELAWVFAPILAIGFAVRGRARRGAGPGFRHRLR